MVPQKWNSQKRPSSRFQRKKLQLAKSSSQIERLSPTFSAMKHHQYKELQSNCGRDKSIWMRLPIGMNVWKQLDSFHFRPTCLQLHSRSSKSSVFILNKGLTLCSVLVRSCPDFRRSCANFNRKNLERPEVKDSDELDTELESARWFRFYPILTRKGTSREQKQFIRCSC